MMHGQQNVKEKGIRRTHLLGDLEGKRGFWKLKEEALDRTVWRTRFEIDMDLPKDRLRNE